MTLAAPVHVLVMGVAGCGKSTLAAAVAAALDCPLIEGDDHHPPQSRHKMAHGIALDDADRTPWLVQLGVLLGASRAGAVLTCSALKRRYRVLLCTAVPGLATVYLAITPEEARARVEARAGHLFPASLVDSQFAALESPDAEPRVLRVDATHAHPMQARQVLDWLGSLPVLQPPYTL